MAVDTKDCRNCRNCGKCRGHPADEKVLYIPNEMYYLTKIEITKIITELNTGKYDSLDLGNCHIDKNGFKSLRKFIHKKKVIKSLYISDHRITNNDSLLLGLALARKKAVTRLSITFSRMGDLGLFFMRDHLPNLTHLNLNNADLTDRGCGILLKRVDKSVLQSLNLGCNNLGPMGIKLIKEYCDDESTILQSLNVSHNLRIGFDGVMYALNILEKNTSLKELGVWSLSMRTEHIVRLEYILKHHNTTLEKIDIGVSFEADGYILIENIIKSRNIIEEEVEVSSSSDSDNSHKKSIHFKDQEFILEIVDRIRNAERDSRI